MELSLTRYLVQFATERYAEIRIDQTGEKGFKIPVSCQVAETVYLIPREYEVTDEKGGGSGFLQEVYAGSIQTTKYIQPVVYQRDEDYCYVSRDSIPAETTLVKLDSQDRFTVRLTTAISGVYRINTGYTVFCPIEILERSGEYLLVRRGTPNGIATYDSLLLNASAYSTGQILR